MQKAGRTRSGTVSHAHVHLTIKPPTLPIVVCNTMKYTELFSSNRRALWNMDYNHNVEFKVNCPRSLKMHH